MDFAVGLCDPAETALEVAVVVLLQFGALRIPHGLKLLVLAGDIVEVCGLVVEQVGERHHLLAGPVERHQKLPLLLPGGVLRTQAAPATQPDPNPILLTDPVPDPRQGDVVYFPQTGHTLRSLFLRYWQEHGGLEQFGYPLTEEFFEPSGPDNAPLQVQYFERNRFELHPENTGTPYEVLLGTLSREFRAQDPPAPQQADTLYFPETGHNLSGAFRTYWETHGGLAVHGYPITEAASERSTNGKDYLVQWFERSRFELHPENAGSEYEVLLGLLGR